MDTQRGLECKIAEAKASVFQWLFCFDNKDSISFEYIKGEAELKEERHVFVGVETGSINEIVDADGLLVAVWILDGYTIVCGVEAGDEGIVESPFVFELCGPFEWDWDAGLEAVVDFIN